MCITHVKTCQTRLDRRRFSTRLASNLVLCQTWIMQGSPPTWCKRPGCRLRPTKHMRVCEKHRLNWDACIKRGCAQPIVVHNKCERHRPGPNGLCSAQRCEKPRFKAGLCYHHFQKNNPPTCARGGCENTTVKLYCRTHDVGIDFAAGDWFDEVAVDQLWWGRLNPERKPTVPELNELFERAESEGVGVTTLARQVRISEDRLKSWRQILGRVASGDPHAVKREQMAELFERGVPSLEASATLDMPWTTVRNAYKRLREAA